MLLVAENSQRGVAFLPWVPVRLKALKVEDWTHEPVTLGEHIRKARRQRGLLQREVAKALGVDSMSLVNWEKNRTRIGARFVPAIIRWLGYDPLPIPSSFGSWIEIERTRRGLARRALAHALGWDESTIRKYEEDDRSPDSLKLAQLRAVLGTPVSRVLMWPSKTTDKLGPADAPSHSRPNKAGHTSNSRGPVGAGAEPEARRLPRRLLHPGRTHGGGDDGGDGGDDDTEHAPAWRPGLIEGAPLHPSSMREWHSEWAVGDPHS